MADVLCLTIADALVAELRAQIFTGLPFRVQRAYVPYVRLDDAATMTITVRADSDARTILTRDSDEASIKLQVGLQQKLQRPVEEERDEVDRLLDFATAVRDHVNRLVLLGGQWIVTIVEHAPLVDPLHLRDQRFFTSLLTLTVTGAVEA